MSSKKGRKKRKSRKAKKSAAVSQKKGVSNPGGAPALKKIEPAKSGPAGEISRLISKGDIKSAVNRAKQFHKVSGTKASEAILVEAYIAKILEMNEKGLTVEADALLELVRGRYHLPASRLSQIETAAAVRGGINDEFLAPLNDPDTPPERRAAIQNTVKEKVTDLTTLTACKTLSSKHPLKVQAAALKNAFKAVTSGPVHPEEVALPGIPRRSPLAPWKMLIKALFFFYRREDALCERSLKGVESGSAPARLVPVIRAMVQGRRFGTPGESVHSLVERVTGNRTELLKSLRNLDSVLDAGNTTKLSSAIRHAISRFEKFRPELIEALKQGISIRSWMMEADEKRVRKAMGGTSLKNARFWNLLARAAETKGEHFLACALWHEFIKHAVHEKIFPENSLESSVVYFHMANLLAGMEDAHFEWSRSRFEEEFQRNNGLLAFYAGQPESIVAVVGKRPKTKRHPWFFYPERLYGRVCEIAPFYEAFNNWLEWMKKGNFKKKNVDAVAISWHNAFPQEITPVLHLAQSAEKRNAFKKCLAYVDEAERIDALHPAIKKIRLRILTATAIRHLKQKKTHLARKDFNAMESLPLFQVGDRAAFLTALKRVCALIDGSAQKMRVLYDELLGRMGSELAATLILLGLLDACGVREADSGISFKSLEGLNMDDLPSSIGRACLLGDDVGLPIDIPPFCVEDLEDEFSTGTPALDAPVINAIGAAALRGNFAELAYAVSGAGLLRGGTTVARSLLLRAGALPFRSRFRKKRCIDAAIALAQRERDMDLIAEAIDLRRNVATGGFLSHLSGIGEGQNDFSTDPEALEKFLDDEKAARDYPYDAADSDFPDDDDDDDFAIHQCRCCDKKGCADRKAEYVPGLDDDDWDPDDDDPFDEEDEEMLESLLEEGLLDLPADIPPEAVPIMLEMMLKFGDKDGEMPELDEVFRKDPELGERLLKILPDLIFLPELEEKGKKKKRKGKR